LPSVFCTDTVKSVSQTPASLLLAFRFAICSSALCAVCLSFSLFYYFTLLLFYLDLFIECLGVWYIQVYVGVCFMFLFYFFCDFNFYLFILCVCACMRVHVCVPMKDRGHVL
ncbi:emopamil binding protein-like, isoform CRA_a, partial [Mus musculus]